MSEQQEDSEDERQEAKHFREVSDCFVNYASHHQRRLARRRRDFGKLSAGDRALMPGYSEHLENVSRAIDANANFLRGIVSDRRLFAEQVEDDVDGRHDNREASNSHEHGSDDWSNEFNMDKLRSTVRQLVRDWSVEGADERQQCYKPLIDALMRLKPVASTNHSDDSLPPCVLVPGAGLARLAFEIARLGYRCTGNEFSYHMLLVSNWVLNQCPRRECVEIFPAIHQVSNQRSRANVLRAVRVPDVCPSDYADVLARNGFSMAAGDFVEIFSDDDQRGEWDAIVTCFFVDTAHNVAEYARVIHQALKPGGVWLNLGPLLYHYADMKSELSIELEADELLAMIERVGFRSLAPVEWHRCTYVDDSKSMLHSVYDCIFNQFQK